LCVDSLPDGQLIVVSARDGRLLRRKARRLADRLRRPHDCLTAAGRQRTRQRRSRQRLRQRRRLRHDGRICTDADGAVWYADVPNKRCVRVREAQGAPWAWSCC